MSERQVADYVVVWIDWDEWYPVYDISTTAASFKVKAVLSQEDYDFVNRAFDDFERAQEILDAAKKDAQTDGPDASNGAI